jgi:RimJ/RimL family protein N-acetyltransferase
MIIQARYRAALVRGKGFTTAPPRPDNDRMPIFLETERVRLRTFTADDTDSLYELHNDPDVMRYLNGGKPTSREAVEERTIPRALGFYEQYGHLGYWAAETKTDGEFLGWFHLLPNDDGSVDLGYRLAKAAWNQGYASEVSRALIARCFSGFGVERVTARAMTVNGASRRVMEKCGLRLIGSYAPDNLPDIPGAGQGAVEYAITREEWHGRLGKLLPASRTRSASRRAALPGNTATRGTEISIN